MARRLYGMLLPLIREAFFWLVQIRCAYEIDGTYFQEGRMSTTTQTIIVTGSNSGFGRLIVETLARQGAHVFAGMREMDGKNKQAATELQALAQQERLALEPVNLDVTDDMSVQQAIDYVVQKSGRIDVVVNNAGVSSRGPLDTFSIAQIQRQFDTNVFGVWRMNHAAIPHMQAQKSGLLLQMGSITGRMGLPFVGAYGSTKFALEGMTETYRYELAPFGIDVAIVEPGSYPTGIAPKRFIPEDTTRLGAYARSSEDFRAPVFADNKGTTPSDPQEVVDAVVRLIALPAGTRPVHTVVAPAFQRVPVQEINDATERATRDFLEKPELIHGI
jgi:NAD(P)-dependent dehydrogenase (short-subunit alcohol dehydrogenase family)